MNLFAPTRTFLLLFALALVPVVATAQNWPAWRGPHLNGVSDSQAPPVEWSKTKNVLWRTELPGPAGSTPVVWGDQIFLTSTEGDKLVVMCLGTDGKEQWKHVVAKGNKDVRGDEGNSASPSPSTDGKHVWAFFANGAFVCYDIGGKEIWKFSVEDRFGKLEIAFGMTSTPIVDGDRIYMQLIHGEGDVKTREATVACLDALTGETIWKTGRPSDAHSECEHSYASPILYRDDQRAYLVTHGADYTVAHSLEDGSEIWRLGDLNPKGNYNPTLRFVASPAANEGIIVVPTAKNGKVVAIDPAAEGDISDNEKAILWTMPNGTPDVPSPLIIDGIVYLCRENGNLIALDAEDGDEYYEERTVRDRHRASPVWAAGKVYTTARNGTVTVSNAGKKYQKLAENAIGEPMTASPILLGDRIYLRSFEALWAIGEK